METSVITPNHGNFTTRSFHGLLRTKIVVTMEPSNLYITMATLFSTIRSNYRLSTLGH